MRSLPAATLLAIALGSPAPSWAQAGWYLIPSLSLSEEFDDNVLGQTSGQKSDFITRVTPGFAVGYVSVPLTLLGSYSVGAEFYAKNSELGGIRNRERVGLDFRYLPSPRVTLALAASYSQAESTTPFPQQPAVAEPGAAAPVGGGPGEPRVAEPGGPMPGVAPPGAAPEPAITGFEIGRRRTTQVLVSPSVSYVFTPLTRGDFAYRYSRVAVQAGSTDSAHETRLGVAHQLTPRDLGTLSYGLSLFDSEQGDSPTSHVLTAGWSRRLTERTDLAFEAGPRFSDGDVSADVNARLAHRFQSVALAVGYARTLGLVAGRAGAQDTDSLFVTSIFQLRRAVQASLGGSYMRASGGDQNGARDTTVYAAQASISYQVTQWVSVRAAYRFSIQEDGGAEIRHHALSVGLDFSSPVRLD
jgi:hypothetical protein